jgi:hypothetical protein
MSQLESDNIDNDLVSLDGSDDLMNDLLEDEQKSLTVGDKPVASTDPTRLDHSLGHSSDYPAIPPGMIQEIVPVSSTQQETTIVLPGTAEPDDLDDPTDDVPNIIEQMYHSMSGIVETISVENIALKTVLEELRNDISKTNHALSIAKLELEEIRATFIIEKAGIDQCIKDVQKRLETLALLQRQLIDTRNTLIQLVTSTSKSIKEELKKMIADEVRKQIQELK